METNYKEYTYRFTHRGLFSELNSFLGFDVTNFGIGGTNSIYGLMQILKHDILENFDVLIIE